MHPCRVLDEKRSLFGVLRQMGFFSLIDVEFLCIHFPLSMDDRLEPLSGFPDEVRRKNPFRKCTSFRLVLAAPALQLEAAKKYQAFVTVVYGNKKLPPWL